jgi:hypothetical protein
MITGRRYASQSLRRRRQCRLTVSGAYNDGGGYMEALKRLLRGGSRLVRLRSYPLVFGALPDDATRRMERLEWFSEGYPLEWETAGDPMLWLTGPVISASPTTWRGFPAVELGGLPSSALVARVGEFITVTAESGEEETRIVLQPVRTNHAGIAIAVVDEAFTIAGRADVGASETGVFEPLSMPRTMRPVGEEWLYEWEFSEVFADEVDGFDELDPWARATVETIDALTDLWPADDVLWPEDVELWPA